MTATTIVPADLVEGQKYQLQHRSPMQRHVRQSVMVFLGHRAGNMTSWSARPAAGTQELPAEWIVSIDTVGKSQTCYLNRIRQARRCDANSQRGTGTGVCDAPLDRHGNCPRAGAHVEG